MTKIKIFNPFYKLQPTVHCQNPGRTEVIQHWGANSALPKSRADGSYSTLGRYSASVSGGRVTFKFVFKI